MHRLILSVGCALQIVLGQANINPALRNIFTFPNNTFVENIAVRANGHLIVASPSVPTLFIIDPTVSSPTASVVHSFPVGTGPWGITELKNDVFVVVTGST